MEKSSIFSEFSPPNSAESVPEEQNIELVAMKTLKINDELYKVVDFLNKSLKEHQIMFGLTKNAADSTMTVKIYRY